MMSGCWLSATAYSIDLHLPSISGGHLLRLQPEDMVTRDPLNMEMWIHMSTMFATTHPKIMMSEVWILFGNIFILILYGHDGFDVCHTCWTLLSSWMCNNLCDNCWEFKTAYTISVLILDFHTQLLFFLNFYLFLFIIIVAIKKSTKPCDTIREDQVEVRETFYMQSPLFLWTAYDANLKLMVTRFTKETNNFMHPRNTVFPEPT
jgi:hypothetical protein